MEIDLQISKTSLRLSKGKLGMNIHTHTTKYKIDNQWGSTYRTGTSPQYLYNLHCCSLVMSDSFVIPWTAVGQAPLSMGFPASILEWVAISSPGDVPDPGIGPMSTASLPHCRRILHHWAPRKPRDNLYEKRTWQRMNVCMYILEHFAVHLKLTQHCKSMHYNKIEGKNNLPRHIWFLAITRDTGLF